MTVDDGLGLARTNAEAHVFMSLQPCPSCGETRCDYHGSVIMVAGDLASRYTGTCPRCGQERRYEFRIPARILPPPSDHVRFGGDEPSELLDPGQWLAYADDRARQVPTDVSTLDSTQRRAARHALATAIAAMDEVLKFVPPGAEAVPASAFVSPAGRAVHDHEPGRFAVPMLLAVRDHYADHLSHWPG